MITLHHHVHRVGQHIKTHHRKYLFGSLFGGLMIKLMIVMITGAGLLESSRYVAHAAPSFDCTTVTDISETECNALVDLYMATDGDNWTSTGGWLTNTTVCGQWNGVSCVNNIVDGLNLTFHNLSGDIPSSLGDLTGLQYIWMVYNHITSLPPEIANLSHLQVLSLDHNMLTSIPAEIGYLNSLTDFTVGFNQLTSLPIQISNLSSLQNLTINDNQLTDLSSSIGSLTNLRFLLVYQNQLSSLPPEIGNLSALQSLDIHHNNITTLPSEIGNLSHLTQLSVQQNQLSSLPSEIGNLSHLTYLIANDNSIDSLPSSIGNLSALQSLQIIYNQLSFLPLSLIELFKANPSLVSNTIIMNNPILDAAIAEHIYTGTDLSGSLLVSGNQYIGFSGTSWDGVLLAPQLATGTKKAVYGETGLNNTFPVLSLEVGATGGDIVPYTGTFTISVKVAGVASGEQLNVLRSNYHDGNTWTGNVPSSTCIVDSNGYCSFQADHLSLFTLTQNTFSCLAVHDVPQSECQALVDLYNATDGDNWLNKEGFDGVGRSQSDGWLHNPNTICSWYGVGCNGQHIDRIYSPGNNLSGAIPASIGNLTELVQLGLDQNHITSLPTEIGNLSSLNRLNLYDNLIPSLPIEIWNLTGLTDLDIAVNPITSLPTEIGNLSSLKRLNLYGDSLSSLPSSIGNLSHLTALYVDNNQLTSLPAEMENLSNLHIFSATNNAISVLPARVIQLFHAMQINNGHLYTHGNPLLDTMVAPTLYTGHSLSGSLLVSGNQYIGFSGTNWNGVFVAPQLATGTKKAVYGETGLNNTFPVLSLEVGATGADLIPYTGSFTIRVKVAGAVSGQQFDIFRSNYNDGNTWTGNVPSSTCTLDSNGYCTFQADHLSLFTLTQNTFNCLVDTDVPQTECQALVDLYSGTHGDHWINTGGWLLSPNLCSWYGISCANNSVSWINMPSNNLSGAIPASFGNLDTLRHILLNSNHISSLPTEIGNISHLQQLDLSDNDLTTLPTSLGNFTGFLVDLDLSLNLLTGVPAEIGNLIHLKNLDLSYNAITALPTSIGQLDQLCTLYANNNQLTSLPVEISNLSSLRSLELANNQLTSLPSDIGNGNLGLGILVLDGNQITSLPDSIGNFSSLETLSLSGNALSSLPSSIIELMKLNPSFVPAISNNAGLQSSLAQHLYSGTSLSGSLLVSGNQYIGFSGTSWDGSFLAPQLTTGTKKAAFGESGLAVAVPLETIEVGSTTADIIPYTGSFTISVKIASGSVGQHLSLFRSNYNDGNTWAVNSPSSTCTLDSNNYCTFQADHLSLFTFGGVANFSVDVPTYSNTLAFTGTLSGNVPANYELSGNGLYSLYTGSFANSLTLPLRYSTGDGLKSFVATFSTGTLVVTGIVTGYLDMTLPVITGTSLSNTLLSNGGATNTGVTLTFSDTHLSGATLTGLNGTNYFSGNLSNGTLITGDGVYLLTVTDLAGNSSSLTFSIDTTAPTVSLLNPAIGAQLSGSNFFTFSWSGADDLSGVGISGYQFSVYSGATLLSGISLTGTSIVWSVTSIADGNYTWQVVAMDHAGNTGASPSRLFNYADTISPIAGITPSTGAWTSGNVYVQLTGFSEPITGFNATGHLFTGNGSFTFTFSDYAGNTGATTAFVNWIDKSAPVVTGSAPLSGSMLTGNRDVSFSWAGSDSGAGINSYTLVLSGMNISEHRTFDLTGTSKTLTNLPNGDYVRYVVAHDNVGLQGTSTVIPFTLHVPLTTTRNITGTNFILNNAIYYTTGYISVFVNANQSASCGVTGNATNNGTIPATLNNLLTGSDGSKVLYFACSTGVDTSAFSISSLFLDTTGPLAPTLSSPSSGGTASGAFTLTWNAATDAGVGISGYTYYISSASGTVIKSGSTTSTSANIANLELGMTGTFYWYVVANDKFGQIGTPSSSQSFVYSGIPNYTPTSFSLGSSLDVPIKTSYTSPKATIAGLSTGTYSLASIDKGVLYINDVMTGSSGYVKNGDTVKIELISSSKYNTKVRSILTIGNFSTSFSVTTETDASSSSDISSNLSSTAKLQVAMIFTTLKDMYSSTTLRTNFLTTLLSMLKSKINELDGSSSSSTQDKIDALQYLYDLTYEYLGGDVSIDTSNRYTAPNGKVYSISYDSATQKFTSPNFIYAKSFTTLDALKAYIDKNNGGTAGGGYSVSGGGRDHVVDTTWQAAPYTAPGGKVYRLFKTTDDRYSSYDFKSAKYFSSVETLKAHIYNANKK